MLKPQDVVLLLKILIKDKMPWTQPGIASELCMSASEVNAGIKRLKTCGLIEPDSPENKLSANWQVIKPRLKEFLLHGIKYTFPAQKAEPVCGIPTSLAHNALQPHFQNAGQDGQLLPVWPEHSSKVQGFTLKPLYPSVIKAIQSDADLYEWLAIVDALRDWQNPEPEVAKVLCRDKLAGRNLSKKIKQTLPELEASSDTDQQLDLLGA